MSNNQSNPSSHTTGKVHDNLAIILNPNGTITRIGPNPIALATPDPNTSSPVLTKDLPLNPHHNTWVRIFMPRQALDTFSSTTKYTKLPLIVYFHGGGFILYSAASTFFHNFCVEMTIQAGVAIVSVEHRLAPEHRLPAAYDDAMDALLWIRTSQDVWLRDFTDITRCFIMGTSSGGNIAYHAGLHAAAEVSDLAPLKIRGLVLHEPAFGGTERSGSELRLINDPILPMFLADLMWELALPIGADRDHKYCNPTVDSESSWEKMRKLGWRVMVAGYKGDPMVDRQMELGKALKKKGVEVVAEFSEEMRLLTHNMLSSNIKGVTISAPFSLVESSEIQRWRDRPSFTWLVRRLLIVSSPQLHSLVVIPVSSEHGHHTLRVPIPTSTLLHSLPLCKTRWASQSPREDDKISIGPRRGVEALVDDKDTGVAYYGPISST